MGDVTCDATDVALQLLSREAGHVGSEGEADQVDIVQRGAVPADRESRVSVTQHRVTGSRRDAGSWKDLELGRDRVSWRDTGANII